MKMQALKGFAVAAFIVMLGASSAKASSRCFGQISRLTSWREMQCFRPAPTP